MNALLLRKLCNAYLVGKSKNLHFKDHLTYVSYQKPKKANNISILSLIILKTEVKNLTSMHSHWQKYLTQPSGHFHLQVTCIIFMSNCHTVMAWLWNYLCISKSLWRQNNLMPFLDYIQHCTKLMGVELILFPQ